MSREAKKIVMKKEKCSGNTHTRLSSWTKNILNFYVHNKSYHRHRGN